ncbi:hypothetical protein [Streptacidiphilus sp. EB129]|uniref:hypothetical protein n=1 Tax=Streptacidiphilus sp. EB129 TaxID=3156262 RepID=UPI0035121B1F
MAGHRDWERRLPRALRPPALFGDGTAEHAEHVVTPALALFFLGSALVLAPWTAWLFLTLPPAAVAAHWNLAWGGFDALMIVAFIGAGVRILRVSARGAVVTAAACALLVTDAWFDVMTASTRDELVEALLMAGLVELPMAALCLRTSLRVVGLLEQARPHLLRAGFTIRHGRLVPPPDWERTLVGRGVDPGPDRGSDQGVD